MIPLTFPTPELREFLIKLEGLRLRAYKCSAAVWTIGYGHTPSYEGQEITLHMAENLLMADITRIWFIIMSNVTVSLLPNQMNALISLVFNIGVNAFKHSTLLMKLNGGDYKSAGEEFPKWVHAGKKVIAGLVIRRNEELKMWKSSD